MMYAVFSYAEDHLGTLIGTCQKLRGDKYSELVHVGLYTGTFYTHRVLTATEVHNSIPYVVTLFVAVPAAVPADVLARAEVYIATHGQMCVLSPLWGDTCVTYVRYLLGLPCKRQSVSGLYDELANGHA